MMPLKPLSRGAVPAALAKAERYRLLNEPQEAESICLDIVEVEPDNQLALTLLLLALTDQFDEGGAELAERAQRVLERLQSDYERAYYGALIRERRAKAHLRLDAPGAKAVVFQDLEEAMRGYERAEALRPPGNDDALLRWNACARLLNRRPDLDPGPEERVEPYLE